MKLEKVETIKTHGGRRPGSGRRAGVPNALSRTAKENIAAVFDRIGGHGGMAEWATENKTEFYRIYARLLPHEVAGSGPGGEFVIRWLKADEPG